MPSHYAHKISIYHDKSPNVVTGPYTYEVPSASSTKGCSKQIHELLRAGGSTLLHVPLHFHTYAAACSLALPHMRQATLLDVPLRFHTYVILDWKRHYPHAADPDHYLIHFRILGACTCWAEGCPWRLQTSSRKHSWDHGCQHTPTHSSQNSLLCWWLRSLQTTSARKTPQMAKRCPQPRWVCEALRQKTHS